MIICLIFIQKLARILWVIYRKIEDRTFFFFKLKIQNLYKRQQQLLKRYSLRRHPLHTTNSESLASSDSVRVSSSVCVVSSMATIYYSRLLWSDRAICYMVCCCEEKEEKLHTKHFELFEICRQ
jgi:hypothetical protein